MANNQKEDLFLLIKKLSKTEIKQFKKTSTLTDGTLTEYIRLFEEIELQENYNEAEILKKLNKTQPQLSRIKNYLFEKIVNYLNEIYQDEDNLIQSAIKSYDTFINIDLPDQALKYLLEAKKYAVLYSRNNYLHIINNKELEYNKTYHKLSEKSIKDYFNAEQNAVAFLKENAEYAKEIAKYSLAKKHFIYIKTDDSLVINEGISHSFSDYSLLTLNYYEHLKNCHYNKGDIFNAILVSANIIEYILLKKLNPNLFFKNLSILFEELLVLKRTKEFSFFEKKVITFFNSFSESQKIHFKFEYTFCLFKCRYYMALSKKDYAFLEKIVNDYENTFLREQSVSNNLLFFNLCSAHLHFSNGKYKEALKSLSHFHTSNDSINIELQFEACLLRIATRLLKQDTSDLIESEIRAINKWVKKIDGEIEFEKIALNCLNKINVGQIDKLKRDYPTIKQKLQSKEFDRKRLFYSFNFPVFLESFLTNTDYKSLLFKR